MLEAHEHSKIVQIENELKHKKKALGEVSQENMLEVELLKNKQRKVIQTSAQNPRSSLNHVLQ